jgi:uncharacterized protein with ATP-grasp and redox domains
VEQNNRGTYKLNIQSACIECIINQSRRVGEVLSLDAKTIQKLVDTTTQMSKEFSFMQSPPEVATPVYDALAKIVQKEDLYDEAKEKSMQTALSFVPVLQQKIATADDKFLTALKIAIAGNVMDLAAEVTFDLEKELEKIFHTPLARDESKALYEKLQQAKKVVVLGDNTGEHVFDKLFIQTLQEIFPAIEFYYFVRTRPIINDVTPKEAKAIDFESTCKLIDSGVDTPGFTYNRATQEAKNLFDSADIVISKGMGNYECLSPSHKSPIAFLLKVKCNVVAQSIQQEVGDMVCFIN